MAYFSRAIISKFPIFRYSSLTSSISLSKFSLSHPSFTSNPTRKLTLSAQHTTSSTNSDFTHQSSSSTLQTMKPTWKPMCLYYTQGKCTLMDDPSHLDKFNHSCAVPLEVDMANSEKLHSQHVDFLLVLDLEGKVEILEFPVMVIDAKTMQVVDLFHRFVRPSKMSEHRIDEYIEGKYGKLGVDRVWHETAIPFQNVIEEFEAWMTERQLWRKELRGLHNAAFVTCGNWDIKTKIPQQCQVCSMKIPPYFMEWINLKDIYLNFYNRRAPGMRSMLNELRIPLLGSHHLGIDDTKNIAKVVQRMLADGAVMDITARRKPHNPDTVEFLFKNRIR